VLPVKYFDSEDAMGEYMESSNYLNAVNPGICMGIAIVEEGNG